MHTGTCNNAVLSGVLCPLASATSIELGTAKTYSLVPICLPRLLIAASDLRIHD